MLLNSNKPEHLNEPGNPPKSVGESNAITTDKPSEENEALYKTGADSGSRALCTTMRRNVLPLVSYSATLGPVLTSDISYIPASEGRKTAL